MKIIQDTREQSPWTFDIETEIKKLDVGDYSLEGYEHLFSIERKASTGEISRCIGIDRKRFEAEVAKMTELRYPYLICEFPITYLMDFPKNSGIPQHLWNKLKINRKFLIKKMSEYEEMGLHIYYCDNRFDAQKLAEKIFRYVDDNETA